MSRIACAWRSESAKRAISAPRAAAGVVGAADDRDHLVEVVERDREALEQMGARLGLGEVVGGAPHHDLAAEVEEVLERLLQRERLRAGRSTSASRFTPKVRLQRRLLVELVQDHLAGRVAASAR